MDEHTHLATARPICQEKESYTNVNYILLGKQLAKCSDDPDSITQIVLKDNVLRELSIETPREIRDYWRNEPKKKQPNL